MLTLEQSDQILQRLLQIQQIGHAITDRAGIITGVHGPPHFIDPTQALGQPISTVIPELIGCEEELRALLDGEKESFRLPLINRHEHNGGTSESVASQTASYVNILIMPHHHHTTATIIGLSVFAEDATEEGTNQQRIMQQRNELTLLRGELERRNRQLQATNQELEQLNDLKSRFVAVAAHELRTPLTAISGYTELLSDGSFGVLGQQQHRPLDIIAQSTERLLLIINNLLDISRIEAGQVQMHLRPLAIEGLIQRCLDEAHLHFNEKRQSIVVDLPPQIPTLLCDEARTMQILGNLISNANKYTPEEGMVTVAAAPTAEDGYVRISVTDTGIGIPPAEQEHVFESFYRASNVNEIQSIGAGLGLNVARALVELQGGLIWCESAPETGTIFTFTVPLAE